jgi:hypothetical protein
VTRAGLLLVAVAGTALAAGITITPAVRTAFENCPPDGSSAQTVTRGGYLLTVTDADAFVCWGSSCASGGEKFSSGTMLLLNIPATQEFSCRSADATADVSFVRAN